MRDRLGKDASPFALMSREDEPGADGAAWGDDTDATECEGAVGAAYVIEDDAGEVTDAEADGGLPEYEVAGVEGADVEEEVEADVEVVARIGV